MPSLFENREDAGRQLAGKLKVYREQDPVIFALPRGGVPVAAAAVRALGKPAVRIIALPVRKIGAPGNRELGIGALAPGGVLILNDSLMKTLGVSQGEMDMEVHIQQAELERRAEAYGFSEPLPDSFRTAIVVDDGLATGITALAALNWIRKNYPGKKTVVAVPVCSREAAILVKENADELIALNEPEIMFAVGELYLQFPQVDDAEVKRILAENRNSSG